MQTRPGLTNYPRTRPSRARSNSHTMMLEMASLLLILYWMGQIPLAQGQIPRKDELKLTEQTWYNHELDGNSRESMKVLQERPAPRYSGVVNGARKNRSEEEALNIEIPPQEFDKGTNYLNYYVR